MPNNLDAHKGEIFILDEIKRDTNASLHIFNQLDARWMNDWMQISSRLENWQLKETSNSGCLGCLNIHEILKLQAEWEK